MVGPFREIDPHRSLESRGQLIRDGLGGRLGADAKVCGLVGSLAAAAKAGDAFGGRPAEHRTLRAVADPRDEHRVGCVEPDDRTELGQEFAGRRLGDQAATAGDDQRTGTAECLLERTQLEVAKARFPVGRDDRGRRTAQARRDLVVQVDRVPAERSGDQRSDGALARPRKPDQRDAADTLIATGGRHGDGR